MKLKLKDIARELGVSEPRVSQLKGEGRLEYTRASVENFKRDRKARIDWKIKYREREDRWRRDVLDRLDTLNDRLATLNLIAGGSVVASRIGQGR